MSVGVTIVNSIAVRDCDLGRRWRMVRLDITGLSAGANIIPHGLLTTSQDLVTIQREDVLLTSAVAVHQTQPGDSSNLYYTVDSGAGGTISIWVMV